VQGSFELVLVHLRASGKISPLRFFVELRSGRFPPAPVLAAVLLGRTTLLTSFGTF